MNDDHPTPSYLCCLLLLLLLAACASRSTVGEQLRRADSLLDSHPDSALRLLESIASDSLPTGANRAYYALLLTQARDKNYIPQTDDSLIRSAAHYYDRRKDAPMQARAYYLWGGVYRDRHELAVAVEKYLEAAQYAQKAQNIVLLGCIYNSVGYIYYSQGLNQQADSISLLTGQIAIQLHDSLLWIEAMALQGKIKMKSGADKYSDAEQLLLRALDTAQAMNYIDMESSVASALSTLYSWMDQEEKSLYYAKCHFALQADTLHNQRALMQLGNAYYKLGQYDSAAIYLNQSLDKTNDRNYGIKSDIYMRLADIANKQGKQEETIAYEKLYSACLESTYSVKQDKEILQVEKHLQAVGQERLKQKVQSIQSRLIIVCLIVLLLLFAIWWYRQKTKRSECHHLETEQKQQEVYRTIKQQLAEKEQAMNRLQKEMEQLCAGDRQKKLMQEELARLTSSREALVKGAYEHSDGIRKMKQIIQDYKKKDKSELILTEQDWQYLIAETDARWSNITLRLRERYNLNPEEIRICCLYLTEIPVSHLQYILNCSRDSIYRKGYQILEEKMGLSRKETSLKDFLKNF